MQEFLFREHPTQCDSRKSGTRVGKTKSRISVTTYSGGNQVTLVVYIVQTSHKGVSCTVDIITGYVRAGTETDTSITQFVGRQEVFIRHFIMPTLELLPVGKESKVKSVLAECLVPLQHIIPLPIEILRMRTFHTAVLRTGVGRSGCLMEKIVCPFKTRRISSLDRKAQREGDFQIKSCIQVLDVIAFILESRSKQRVALVIVTGRVLFQSHSIVFVKASER